MEQPKDVLRQWLLRQLDQAQTSWLEFLGERLSVATTDQALYLAISQVPRQLGKADLALSDSDLTHARRVRPGWDARGWSVDQAGRLYLLLTYGGSGDAFAKRLAQLMATADVAEEISFLRGLPLYPNQERHEGVARKGCRTNIRPVFEAVAHNNPYPREQFDENAWNHLVLKALFVGSTLHPIQGFDVRANADLARIMSDYAHERWAAGRSMTPEIWRGVGPFATGSAVDDLKRVALSDDPAERWAGMAALRASSDPAAQSILATLGQDVPAGMTWDNLISGEETA